MRTLRLLLVALLTVVGLAWVATVPAFAETRTSTRTKCKDVSAVATGQGAFQPDGSIATRGAVTKDPLLKGVLEGQFVVTGAPSPDVPFAGEISFRTKKGTLTIAVTGTLTPTGAFVTSGPVAAGTGVFAGATGELEIAGSQDQTGAFTETIEGRVCLSK